MKVSFEADAYPGRPKILFIGLAESTHTHSWIDLLENAEMNVRLFSIPSGSIPPEHWKVRTYVTAYQASSELDPQTRVRLYSSNKVRRFSQRLFARFSFGDEVAFAEKWLSQIIRQWRPNIIHTLGLDPASDFYLRVRDKFALAGIGKWVLQLRGGSDLTLTRLNPELLPQVTHVLRECDQIISDNEQNIRYVLDMGVRADQLSSLTPVPGTGGIDVSALAQSWQGPPSSRRIILLPKAYECPWSKVLPIYEAINLCWDQIQPCEIYLLAMSSEARMWYWTLPQRIREFCRPTDRLPRSRALEIMGQARVMLAPSLIDGIPNSMYEAMAAGAFPIVSPLDTIRSVVANEQNVLFARNLYPNEIAEALLRAMSDDALIDKTAEKNLAVVREIADRSKIRPRVIRYYEELKDGMS